MMTDKELFEYLDIVSKEFKGDMGHLSGAIGAVYIGRLYGWRVLRIITAHPVYTRHQRVLGLDFKDVLPETTDLSERSLGYKMAKGLNKFWEIVKGQYKIDAKDKSLAV